MKNDYIKVLTNLKSRLDLNYKDYYSMRIDRYILLLQKDDFKEQYYYPVFCLILCVDLGGTPKDLSDYVISTELFIEKLSEILKDNQNLDDVLGFTYRYIDDLFPLMDLYIKERHGIIRA